MQTSSYLCLVRRLPNIEVNIALVVLSFFLGQASDRGSLLQAPSNLYKVLLAFSQPLVAYVVVGLLSLDGIYHRAPALLAF